MGEGFNSSRVLVSSGRTMPSRLVIVGVMQVIVSLIALLLLYPISILPTAFDLVVCVFSLDDVS
jgi:hypothetical protein